MSRERWNFWGMGTVFLSNIITRESNLRTAPARRIRESRTRLEGASGVRVRLEDRSRRKSGAPERAAQDRNKPGSSQRKNYFPCFAYQSALTGVKLFHFSGRSSSAKIAVTGQTGTQAPQSMHSVGWMYSCVSASKAGSSLRGWMQSTGQTSTHAVSFVPMHGSAIT